MARQGVYWKLRDPSTPWPDRVKLVRYAWRYSTVHIPNKHQVLLDWLVLSLTGKKRVRQEEADAPWRCLCDMLWTNVCQTGKGSQSTLILKNIVGQVLLEELRGHVNGKPGSCTNLGTLVSCVEAILTSRSLHHVFTNRIETMIQLLAVTADLVAKTILGDQQETTKEVALLDVLLHTLGQTQWRRINTQQALTTAANFLVISAASFNMLVTQQNLKLLEKRARELCEFTCKALFHIDLWEHYQLYLGIKVKAEKPTSAAALPKDIDAVFTVIERLLNNQENASFILDFVPVLYRGFLEAYKVKGTPCGLHLLRHLITLLGVDPQTQGQTEVRGQVMVTLTLLLNVAIEHDVYDVGYGVSPEDRQLPWLQLLGKYLLGLSDRSEEWFESLRLLLVMDHTILEPCLSDIFSTAWVNTTELTVQQSAAQGQLLSELFSLYLRLRRVPVLVDRCLMALRERHITTPLSWPQHFSDSLSLTVCTLPPSTCITLWQRYLTELTSHYLDTDDDGSDQGVSGVTQLLSAVLLHARFVDYTVPHQVTAQVLELVNKTSHDVINVMIRSALKQSHPNLVSVLDLTHACGELRLLLSQFSLLPPGSSTARTSRLSDMTYVHPGLTSDEWEQVFEKASLINDKKSCFLLDKLAIQKLRGVLLCQTAGDGPAVQDTVKQVASHLLKQIVQLHSRDSPVIWNKQVESINQSNYELAVLDLVCGHVPLLVPYWSDAQVTEFVQMVVDVLLEQESGYRLEDGLITTTTLVAGVFASETWNELRTLQPVALTVLINEIANLCTSEKTPKKKKASSTPKKGTSRAKDLLHSLANWHSDSISLSDTEVAGRLRGLSDGVTALFTSPGDTLVITNTQRAFSLLQVLKKLPLEHFLPVNKARCLLFLLALTRTNQSELVQTSLEQLAVVLDSPEMLGLIKELDVGSVLLWMLATANRNEKTLSLREDMTFLLLKQSTKDITSAEKLEPFVKECKRLIMNASNGSEVSGCELSLVTKTLGTLKTVVERAHQDAALRAVCLSYFTQLASATLQLLTCTLQERTKDTALLTCALVCYRHVLDYVCFVKRQHLQKRQQQKATENPQPMETDDQEEDKDEDDASSGDESPSPSDKSSSADSSSDEESDGSEDGLPAEVRTTLMTHLPATCETVQNLLNKKQDTKTVHCCLALVSSICSNYIHLKRSLPDNFRSQVLTLVLVTLDSGRGTGTTETAVTRQQTSTVGTTENLYTREVRSVVDPGHQAMEGVTESESEVATLRDDAQRRAWQTVVAVMSSLNTDQFSQMLHHLLTPITPECLQGSPGKVVTALETLQELLDANLTEDTSLMLKYASQNVLIPIQDVVSACQKAPLQNTTTAVITAALKLQTKMLSFGPSLLSSRSVSICLHSAQYIPLVAVSDIHTFAALHQTLYGILNTMLVKHDKTVFSFIPAFVQACNTLVRSVIVQSDQSRKGLTTEDVETLVSCALRIYRLFSLISTHKVHFAKVAPYIVADYIDNVQKVTVLPKVKKSLIGGVYKILDLCDEHAVRMLSTVLPASGKEIFKTLNIEYIRYYRYRGRV